MSDVDGENLTRIDEVKAGLNDSAIPEPPKKGIIRKFVTGTGQTLKESFERFYPELGTFGLQLSTGALQPHEVAAIYTFLVATQIGISERRINVSKMMARAVAGIYGFMEGGPAKAAALGIGAEIAGDLGAGVVAGANETVGGLYRALNAAARSIPETISRSALGVAGSVDRVRSAGAVAVSRQAAQVVNFFNPKIGEDVHENSEAQHTDRIPLAHQESASERAVAEKLRTRFASSFQEYYGEKTNDEYIGLMKHLEGAFRIEAADKLLEYVDFFDKIKGTLPGENLEGKIDEFHEFLGANLQSEKEGESGLDSQKLRELWGVMEKVSEKDDLSWADFKKVVETRARAKQIPIGRSSN